MDDLDLFRQCFVAVSGTRSRERWIRMNARSFCHTSPYARPQHPTWRWLRNNRTGTSHHLASIRAERGKDRSQFQPAAAYNDVSTRTLQKRNKISQPNPPNSDAMQCLIHQVEKGTKKKSQSQIPPQSVPRSPLTTASSPLLGHRNVPSGCTRHRAMPALLSQSRGRKKCRFILGGGGAAT